MAKTTIVHAWDEFWNTTEKLHLHTLGQPQRPDELQHRWADCASEFQHSGELTVRQILALTELIEATAQAATERERTTLANVFAREQSQ